MDRGISTVASILLVISICAGAATLIMFLTFGASDYNQNTGEPSVRIDDTASGRTVTLIREGEVGRVIIESGNSTHNLTEVGESVTVSRRNGTLVYAYRNSRRELIRQVEPNPINTLSVDTTNFTVSEGSLLISFEASKKLSQIRVGIGGNMTGILTEDDFSLVKSVNRSGETWYRYEASTRLRAYYVVGELQLASTRGVNGAKNQRDSLKIPRPDWLCDRGNLTTTCYVNSSKDLTGNDTTVIGNLTMEEDADVVTGEGKNTTAEVDVGGDVTLNCGDMRGNFNISAQNIIVKSCSSIIADGFGYQAGSGPCSGGSGAYDAGGGGYGGKGGRSDEGLSGGCTYGSVKRPTSLGSGGGSDNSQGDGGGRVILNIENNTEINGKISSNGTNGGDWGGGSGGTISVNTSTLEGNGSLYANGGGASLGGGGGGGGRISVRWSDNSSWSGISEARTGGATSGEDGGVGTVYFGNWTDSKTQIRADACTLSGTSACTIKDGRAHTSTSVSGVSTVEVNGRLTLDNGGKLLVSAAEVTVSDGIVGETGSLVSVTSKKSIEVSGKVAARTVNFTSESVKVQSAGEVSVNGRGYRAGNGPCSGGSGAYDAGGGGYGGRGGRSEEGLSGGCTYGSVKRPTSLGSGGGSDNNQGNGGGRVYINATTASIRGEVSANGSNGGDWGGGSGGSVLIESDWISGDGEVYASGGGASLGGGGGGAGRISFRYNYTSWTGTVAAVSGKATSGQRGGFGSIYFKNVTNKTFIRSDPCYLTGLSRCKIKEGLEISGSSVIDSSTDRHNVTVDSLSIVSGSMVNISSNTFVVDGSASGGKMSEINVVSKGDAEVRGSLDVGTANISSGGSISVASGAYITTDGKGYTYGPCNGVGNGYAGGGGGYGGRGGDGEYGTGGCTFGSKTSPTSYGSGGGYDYAEGGGRVKLESSVSVTVNGNISSDGESNYEWGGGSGGAVYVTAPSVSGSGNISANGGDGGEGGGGGGGRVAIVGGDVSGNVTVLGGDKNHPEAEPGENGTVYNP